MQHSMSIGEFQRLQSAYARGQGQYAQTQYLPTRQQHQVQFHQQMPHAAHIQAQQRHAQLPHNAASGSAIAMDSQGSLHRPPQVQPYVHNMQMPQGHGRSPAAAQVNQFSDSLLEQMGSGDGNSAVASGTSHNKNMGMAAAAEQRQHIPRQEQVKRPPPSTASDPPASATNTSTGTRASAAAHGADITEQSRFSSHHPLRQIMGKLLPLGPAYSLITTLAWERASDFLDGTGPTLSDVVRSKLPLLRRMIVPHLKGGADTGSPPLVPSSPPASSAGGRPGAGGKPGGARRGSKGGPAPSQKGPWAMQVSPPVAVRARASGIMSYDLTGALVPPVCTLGQPGVDAFMDYCISVTLSSSPVPVVRTMVGVTPSGRVLPVYMFANAATRFVFGAQEEDLFTPARMLPRSMHVATPGVSGARGGAGTEANRRGIHRYHFRGEYFHALDGFASTCTPGASPRLCRFRATEAVTVETLPYKLFGFLEAFVYTIFFTHIEPVEERRAWLTQEQAGTVFAQAAACKEHIEAGVQEVKQWLHAGQAAGPDTTMPPPPPGANAADGRPLSPLQKLDMPPPGAGRGGSRPGNASPVTWLSSLTPSSTHTGGLHAHQGGGSEAASSAPMPQSSGGVEGGATSDRHPPATIAGDKSGSSRSGSRSHSGGQSNMSTVSTDTRVSRQTGASAQPPTAAPAAGPTDDASWKRPSLYVAVPGASSSSLPAQSTDGGGQAPSGASSAERRPMSTSVLELRRRNGEGGEGGVQLPTNLSASPHSTQSNSLPAAQSLTTSHLQQAARAASSLSSGGGASHGDVAGLDTAVLASFEADDEALDSAGVGRVTSHTGSDTSRGVASQTPLHPPTMRSQGNHREPAMSPHPMQQHGEATPEVYDPPAPPPYMPQSAIDAFPQFESRGGGVPAFVIRSMVSGRYANQGLVGAVTYNNAVLHAGVTPWRHSSRLPVMPSGRRVAPPPDAPDSSGATPRSDSSSPPAMSADVRFEGGVHGQLCSIEELPLGCARDATSGRIFYVGATDWVDGPAEAQLMQAGQKILEGRAHRKGGVQEHATGGSGGSNDGASASGSSKGGMGGGSTSRGLGVEDPALGAPSPWRGGGSVAGSGGGGSSVGGGLVMPLQLPLVGLPNVVAPAAPAPDIVANPPARPASSPSAGSRGGGFGSRSLPSWGMPGSAGGGDQIDVMGGWGRQSHGSGGASGSGRGGGIAIPQGAAASAEGGSVNGRFTAGSATGSQPGPHGAFSAGEGFTPRHNVVGMGVTGMPGDVSGAAHDLLSLSNASTN